MTDSRLQIGDVEILAFSDAVVDYPWSLAELFPGVPPEAWVPYRDHHPETFADENHLRFDYGCYLVRSRGRTILVDTGMGPAGAPFPSFLQRAGALLPKLQTAGVRPEQVEVVVLTHLHPDHVGWALTAEGAAYRPTFPHARYVIHQADWAAFQSPEVQAHLPLPYVDQTVTPLATLGVLDLVEGEHRLTEELTTVHTPGHTPGHMSILITSGGERGMLVGDVIVHPAQVTEPEWNLFIEMDPETAIATRRRLLHRIEAEGLRVVACHFPTPGFGQVVRLEGRRYWQGR